MLKIIYCIYLFVFYYNLNTSEWLKILQYIILLLLVYFLKDTIYDREKKQNNLLCKNAIITSNRPNIAGHPSLGMLTLRHLVWSPFEDRLQMAVCAPTAECDHDFYTGHKVCTEKHLSLSLAQCQACK